jgi:hypothetical protein
MTIEFVVIISKKSVPCCKMTKDLETREGKLEGQIRNGQQW